MGFVGVHVLRGRAAPMSSALHVVHRAKRSGQGGIILITGEAGIGKTAVLDTVRAEAASAGFVVGMSKADEVDHVSPGMPLLLALRSGRTPLASSKAFDDVNTLVDQPLLLIDRVCALLEEVASCSPVFIAIDDIQWIDRLSRLALRVLPARLSGLPVVWAFTARDRSSGLAEELSGGHFDGVPVEKLVLGPLGLTDLLEVARDWLGHIPADGTRRMLEGVAGTPFLAVQILEGIARARARGENEDQVPAEFVAGVRRHLTVLPATAAELVRLAAVLGRPLTFEDALGLLPDQPPATVSDLIDSVTSSGLFVSHGSLIAFRHDLVRETVYADLSDATRRRMHQRCARYLIHAGHSALSAAPHAAAGGRSADDTSVAILRAAADEALASMPDTAADLIVSALALTGPDQPGYWDVGIRCVDILSRAQRSAQAVHVADSLLRKAPPTEEAARIEVFAARALWLTGRLTESVGRIDTVLSAEQVSAPLQARLRASRALAITRSETAERARAEAEAALALAQEAGDRAALEVSHLALAELAKNSGHHAQSLAHFRELRAIAGAEYLPAEILVLQLLDRYTEARSLLDAARQESGSQAEAVLPSMLHAQMWQDFCEGRLEETGADATALVTLGSELGNHVYELDAVSLLSTLELYRGDVVRARALLTPYLTHTDVDDDVRSPGLILMQGWLAAAEGDVAQALAVLGPLLYAARDGRTWWPWWPGWMPMFARMALAGGDARFAEEAAAIAGEGAARNPGVTTFEGLALHTRGLVHQDRQMLQKAADILKAVPRPTARAAVADDLGRALLAEGHREEGIAHLDRAWQLYHDIGIRTSMLSVQEVLRGAGVRRAQWATGAARPASGWQALTRAELAVTRLIGSGLTNRAVADDLGLSPNTIGTHVRSIFVKLGIHSRVQLANALHRRDAELSGQSPRELRTERPHLGQTERSRSSST
ncbi:AAA family ATPase [Streptomyces sp. NBC_01478]|uniref:AAA family ATPase n=1 Tax=Streptomyces sp. NBC_01478 TaxID=2903882 RepID=UPI002E2FF4D6|nr:AAA family ATPase [Streptomyces sp. NBC_01478]